MSNYKCKKSVFCIYFLILLFCGTISGIFCFRCIWGTDNTWLISYSRSLALSAGILDIGTCLCLLRPYFVLVLVSFLPRSNCVMLVLIFLRGFLTSYYCSALWSGGCEVSQIILRCAVLLPAFFLIGNWLYCRRIY